DVLAGVPKTDEDWGRPFLQTNSNQVFSKRKSKYKSIAINNKETIGFQRDSISPTGFFDKISKYARLDFGLIVIASGSRA
ncbi:MAG: hypothetical protein LBF16_05815, partial [Pseudomonadales bacterium]|nr:hypothetical protein [Pseudomonadales bacterium]